MTMRNPRVDVRLDLQKISTALTCTIMAVQETAEGVDVRRSTIAKQRSDTPY